MNSKPTEFCPVIAALTPRTVDDTPAHTGYADMRTVDQALFVVSLGDMPNEAVTVSLREAKNAEGSDEQPLKSPPAIPAHGTENDHKLILVGVDRRELSPGFTHVRLRVVTSDDTGGPVSVVAVGIRPRYGPGTGLNLAAVIQRTE